MIDHADDVRSLSSIIVECLYASKSCHRVAAITYLSPWTSTHSGTRSTMIFQVLLTSFLAYVVWKIINRARASPNPLSAIPGPQKEHWLKGNYHRIFNKEGWDYNIQLAEKYGGAVKIHGLMGAQLLYISDPRAMYHVVVKEQDVFEETDMFIMGNKLIFGEGLLSTLGDQHRKQRKILNPVFSLSNMRDLLPIIQPIANELLNVLQNQVVSGEQEIDVMKWMSRGAFEYVCQAGLGYTFSALDPSKTNEFTEAVKMLSPTAFRLVLLRPFVPFVLRTIPLRWRMKMVDWFPLKSLKEMRRIVGVMDKTSRTIYSSKIASLTAPTQTFVDGEGDLGPRGKGKDIMTALLKANASASASDRLTEEELLGQMKLVPHYLCSSHSYLRSIIALSFLAAFETTTSALSRSLHVLSERPIAQENLRKEIQEAKAKRALSTGENPKDVELPYGILMELPYLDAICRETLRLYPPVLLLGRTARKATVLPLAFPMRTPSGEEITSVPVPANTNITISILASNRNKRVWGEDANEWKPERWLTPEGKTKAGIFEGDVSSEQRQTGSRYPGVYASMMTFLGGGRACIGFKFAEMEMKQILATLLPTLQFSLPDKKIYWNMSGVQSPVVLQPEGDGSTPQLPLKVRAI
ncbi:hypothetical protein QCA50_013822 [Cerrena zonata]|uniref:Cytochrome P450 n=1 Tax=Cerrena zonata TaxID=2478898 RepID=A0AAW0FVN7_9APHY